MSEAQEPRHTSAEHPASAELSELAFSPETAPMGLREHVETCPACAAEVAELRTVLESLAALPEPVVPVSVGIRLDAAIARAWQEADAESEAAEGAGDGRTSRPPSARRATFWRKVALPVGALCLVILGVVSAAELLGGNESETSGTSAAAGPAVGAAGDPALTAWVRSVLSTNSSENSGSGDLPQVGRYSPNRPLASAQCAAAPARPGYAELTTSQREFQGRPATLVVYQNDQEPASRPLFAVVYAGSCPTASSVILDEGVVSR